MAGFGEYPPNMAPQNALIVRQQAGTDHAVVPYTAEDLSRPHQGPANPFRDEKNALKRKNVLTGYAEETYISEHTFRSQQRAGEGRQYFGGQAQKVEAARIRAKRHKKGDATIAEGDDAYVGPWAKYKKVEYEEVDEDEELASDEVYEEVEEAEFVQSGAVVPALPQALAKRKEVEEDGSETSIFEGSEQYDYQGRTYMHVPQDLNINLLKDPADFKELGHKNFVPKKMIHEWKGHKKPVVGLRFFPGSGHLLLSGSADTTVKIWDAYHSRELLRTYSGHTKSLTDLTFNTNGSQFLTGSYDRQMKLWDTETGQCINRFSNGATPHVLKFHPDPEHSNIFLAGMSDKTIRHFDIRTREMTFTYDHHLGPVNTITFVDENRRFMTTSDDKSLRAWDYEINVPIKFIAEPYMYSLTNASLHPSGKYVAYQSADNNIFVYGATDKFRQNRKKVFKGHNNAGYSIDVACSPDGQFVASGDSGGYVCFWDWKTCKMWHKIKASDGAVTCVQWHPQESSKVATAGLDGSIKYWD